MDKATVVEETGTEKNEFELGMNSPMLERCVTDINSLLNKTVFTMKDKNTSEATVTVKMVISLDDVDDMSKISIKHDVSAVMQLKQKKSGASEGEYVIVFNEETGMFEAKPIKDAQMNFDDVVIADAEDGTAYDSDSTEQRRIGTGRVALPTAEDVVEAAENEIDEDSEYEDYEYDEPEEDEDSDDEDEEKEE